MSSAANAMTRLVQDLLLLARSDEGWLGLNREAVPVLELLQGVTEGARWHVVRGGSIGLLRRPESVGTVVITAVEPERRLAWHDVEQRFKAELLLEPAAEGMTRASLTIESRGLRAVLEGLRPLPRRALARLHALCQTAATL